MSRPAVTVENLGKMYKLGRTSRPTHLRDAITGAASSIYRRLRGFGEDRSQLEDFWALKDVSFEVEQGDAVGILGRNGAGKSTLLKVLSRITEPTVGVARLQGRVGSLLEVGTGFHAELTGRENIYLNGAILGMRRAEINRKFDEIVAFSEIERFLDTPVKRYSSGMYIRLAFAVAAHLEPEILVVDEVLAVGDIDFQKRCLGKMNDVVGHGRTVFFVSHNTQSIAALTNRCLVFKQGQLMLNAPTSEAIKYYIEMSMKGSVQGKPYIAEAKKSNENYIAEVHVKTSEPCGQHIFGEPMTFEFIVHVGEPMERMGLAFSVCNGMGTPITHFWNFDEGLPFQTRPGDYKLCFEIPQSRLYQGSYTVTTWMLETRGHATLDRLTDICPFEVTMGQRVRTGFSWYDDLMVYMEDGAWSPVVEL